MEQIEGKIFKFNLSQYEEHRKLLLADMQEERQNERYVLIAIAVFYSWLLTQKSLDALILGIASLIPTIIVLLGLIRSDAIFNGTVTKSKYLIELESWLYTHAPEGYQGPIGWESYLKLENKYVKRYKLSQFIFWYMLLGLSICTSIGLFIVNC